MNMIKAMVFAVAIGAALVAPAEAATLFFDFGDSSQPTPGNYNNIFVNDTDPVTPGYQPVLNVPNAIDSTGAATGIGLTASGFFMGSNLSGTTTPSGAAAIFDPQATRDNAFGHAAAFGTNPLTPAADVNLTGLNPTMKYEFTLFASRTGVTDIRETKYTVNGSNSASALLNASNNTSNVAILSGIFSTGAGTINVHLEPGPNNNNASLFYYLGALRLNCVPEPTSTLLMLLGFGGLVLCRGAFTAGRHS